MGARLDPLNLVINGAGAALKIHKTSSQACRQVFRFLKGCQHWIISVKH